MGTLNEDLTAIKAVEDKLTANKVANFAYTNHAYNNPLTEADGVETYDVNNEQNIPVANASIMKVNQTILTKGWRSQASSITRMLMNHFLGRCSYNLNKINDLMSNLLSTLMSHLGTANGLATLDANGYVPTTQLSLSKGDVGLSNVVNTGDSAVPAEDGTDKFTTGGAFTQFSNIFEYFSPTKTYYKDDIVFYNNLLYVANKTHTGAWNIADFDSLSSAKLGKSLHKLVKTKYDLHVYDDIYTLDEPFYILTGQDGFTVRPSPYTSLLTHVYRGWLFTSAGVTFISIGGVAGANTYTFPSEFFLFIGFVTDNDNLTGENYKVISPLTTRRLSYQN